MLKPWHLHRMSSGTILSVGHPHFGSAVCSVHRVTCTTVLCLNASYADTDGALKLLLCYRCIHHNVIVHF